LHLRPAYATLKPDAINPYDREVEVAQKLDSFPGLSTRRYPWEEWLNGEVWQLFPEEDFTAKTRTIVATARARAKGMGGTVRTRLLQGENGRESVVLQFVRSAT
jgi:hypothetical protein